MYVLADVPKEILDKIELELKKDISVPYNQNLAGNLKREFDFSRAKPILVNYLKNLIKAHNEMYNTLNEMQATLTKPCDISLISLWVNFQQKYEFNPLHLHEGLYSFVIWYKVPFSMEDEYNQFPKTRKKHVKAGHFSFVHTDNIGRVEHTDLPVDKEWEGKIALFPSNFHHQVYPFFTSDDYRISISGNLAFDTNPK